MIQLAAPRPSLHGFPVRQNLIIPRQDSIPDAFFLPASFFQLLLPPLGLLQLWESHGEEEKLRSLAATMSGGDLVTQQRPQSGTDRGRATHPVPPWAAQRHGVPVF